MKLKANDAPAGRRVGVLAMPLTVFRCMLVFALAPVGPVWAALSHDSGNQVPAGTQLAFVRDDQIYLINADGTGLTRLTDTGAGVANRDPAWSRDGQRLAFARGGPEDGAGTWNIYIMHADGSNVVQLTSGGYNVEPAWGPDDRAIAFTSRLSGSEGVSVIDADSGGPQGSTVLVDYIGWDAQPAWSPDGRTITFSSDYRFYDFVFDLYAMNADGSDVHPILEGSLGWGGETYYFQSAWSPDGQSIGVVICPYAWDDCYPDSAIAVANADGSGLRVIAQAGSYAKPTWSPDGQWIAFGSSPCRSCQSTIRFVHVDSGAEGLIVDNGHSPAWRPETTVPINAGHSGAWYNSATSGQGQFLDVETDQQFVFLGWLTYTDDGSDNPNEQHWFTAEGQFSGSTAELILYESIGGRFDDPQAVTTTPVGNVTLTFADCDQGRMRYHFDDRNLEGSFPMIRAIPGSGDLCENQTESTTQDANVNRGMNGAWLDVDTSGQGFFFDIHAGEAGDRFIFVSWFTYGDGTQSGQRWLTAEGQFEGSRADLVIYDSKGGSFDDPHPTTSLAVGTMRIDFNDCGHAVLSYSLPDEGSEGAIGIQRAVHGGQRLCEELNVLQ